MESFDREDMQLGRYPSLQSLPVPDAPGITHYIIKCLFLVIGLFSKTQW